MDINLPDVLAEVTEVFLTYQLAVDTNDFVTMNTLFWDHASTVRFGPNGTLISHAALAAYRTNRQGRPSKRELRNTVITTFGRDFAATNRRTRNPSSREAKRSGVKARAGFACPKDGASWQRMSPISRKCLTTRHLPGDLLVTHTKMFLSAEA